MTIRQEIQHSVAQSSRYEYIITLPSFPLKEVNKPEMQSEDGAVEKTCEVKEENPL